MVVMSIKINTYIALVFRLPYHCKCRKIYNRWFCFDNNNICVKKDISWAGRERLVCSLSAAEDISWYRFGGEMSRSFDITLK